MYRLLGGACRDRIRLYTWPTPIKIMFFEEPIPTDNLDALANVAANVRVPLPTGEHISTKRGFRPLLERQIVDVIQPDVCLVGGILECRKIAALAPPPSTDRSPAMAV